MPDMLLSPWQSIKERLAVRLRDEDRRAERLLDALNKIAPSEEKILVEQWHYRAERPIDDGEDEHVFRFHFPRGTLAKRMSAYELATFLMPHLEPIIPLLGFDPLNQAHFIELTRRFATCPTLAALDEVLNWVQSVTRAETDDIIVLNTSPKYNSPAGPKYFVLSDGAK